MVSLKLSSFRFTEKQSSNSKKSLSSLLKASSISFANAFARKLLLSSSSIKVNAGSSPIA